MNYEIQIFAKDRTRIIRFDKDAESMPDHKKRTAWEDFYFAMGSVIDDKADKIVEDDTTIGRIHVKNMSFDDVVDAMSEDLPADLRKLLVKGDEFTSIA